MQVHLKSLTFEVLSIVWYTIKRKVPKYSKLAFLLISEKGFSVGQENSEELQECSIESRVKTRIMQVGSILDMDI